MDDTEIISCTIEWDNGVERDTSIQYFIEKALKDPEATVTFTESGEPVTDVTEVVA